MERTKNSGGADPGPRKSPKVGPNVPLFRALWSVFDGTWGILKGSWGVLVYADNHPEVYRIWAICGMYCGSLKDHLLSTPGWLYTFGPEVAISYSFYTRSPRDAGLLDLHPRAKQTSVFFGSGFIHIYMHIYIYMYRQREREKEIYIDIYIHTQRERESRELLFYPEVPKIFTGFAG